MVAKKPDIEKVDDSDEEANPIAEESEDDIEESELEDSDVENEDESDSEDDTKKEPDNEDEDDENNESHSEDDNFDDNNNKVEKKLTTTRKKENRSSAVVINTTIGSIDMLKTNHKKTQNINYADADDNDDNDDDDNTNYLQKFNNQLRHNFILENHPESCVHNYEEVKALSRVSRDGRGIIVDPLHKTIPFLTKYEMTRVIGQRAKQLDSGAKSFVKVPINIVDGYHIALLELEQKKIPFIIKRPFPNGGVEYWNLSDLEVLL